MNKKEILIDINKRINDVNNLENGLEKDLAVTRLKNYIGYMSYTGNISSEELEILYRRIRGEKIDKINSIFKKNGIKNFIRNNQFLMDYYEELLNIYDQFHFNYINDYCDYKKISIGMNCFLKKFKLFDTFKNILDKKMIW